MSGYHEWGTPPPHIANTLDFDLDVEVDENGPDGAVVRMTVTMTRLTEAPVTLARGSNLYDFHITRRNCRTIRILPGSRPLVLFNEALGSRIVETEEWYGFDENEELVNPGRYRVSVFADVNVGGEVAAESWLSTIPLYVGSEWVTITSSFLDKAPASRPFKFLVPDGYD